MKRKIVLFILISLIILFAVLSYFIFFNKCDNTIPVDDKINTNITDIEIQNTEEVKDSIEIINGTYLGNYQNNYYGNKAPKRLDVIWKEYLGYGKTQVGKNELVWYGAGWTGQPLIIREKDKKYLIHGAFDHNLRKIDAQTGKEIWKTKFDDVIKGTGTIWNNKKLDKQELFVLQGSRMGTDIKITSKLVKSFKAVSFDTGEIIWEMNSEHTDCWSRDVDGSAMIIEDTAYIALENGMFTKFNPDSEDAKIRDSILQPDIYRSLRLYENEDKQKHGKNLVVEATPCLMGEHIYIASGSGHLFGYNIKNGIIDFDLNIGSDIDGSPVVTSDSCLLVSIEKQYIRGNGGVFKINPKLNADSSVIWFFPTQNKTYATWNGGVIGSVAINDLYISDTTKSLAAFIGIDGYLYVVAHKEFSEKNVNGPNEKHLYKTPKTVFKTYIGASISTPIFVENKLIAAGYGGICIFEYDSNYVFKLLDYKPGVFESTPVADDSKIYISSRDGYLYCFGEVEKIPEVQKSEKIEKVKSIDKSFKYHIVAGTYKTDERAEIWSKILIDKGFESRIIKVENSYYNIIYSAQTYNEALVKLVKIKEEGTEQVWILNKHIH